MGEYTLAVLSSVEHKRKWSSVLNRQIDSQIRKFHTRETEKRLAAALERSHQPVQNFCIINGTENQVTKTFWFIMATKG